MTKTIFIVGNGPVSGDISADVDATDYVMRFNEPKASIGMTGTKTDILFINNSDKPMQRRLENEEYWTSPIVTRAKQVVLIYEPKTIRKYVKRIKFMSRIKGRKADWTKEAVAAYEAVGKPVEILPFDEFERGYRALGLTDKDIKKSFPSTGYFGIRHVLQNIADTDQTTIHICGFSFEGWGKHSWSEERQWLEEQKTKFNFTVWP